MARFACLHAEVHLRDDNIPLSVPARLRAKASRRAASTRRHAGVPLEHLGSRVYPDMFSLALAHQAFSEFGELSHELLA
jgi:hypothetical protein